MDKQSKTTNPSNIEAICPQNVWNFIFVLEFSIFIEEQLREFSIHSLLNRFLLLNQQSTSGHIEHYFETVEPKKVSQVLEKKYSVCTVCTVCTVCMVCTVCSLHGLRFGVTLFVSSMQFSICDYLYRRHKWMDDTVLALTTIPDTFMLV